MNVIATELAYTRESDGTVFRLSLYLACTPEHQATWSEPAYGGEPISLRIKYRDDPRNEGLLLTKEDVSEIEDWVNDSDYDWDVCEDEVDWSYGDIDVPM